MPDWHALWNRTTSLINLSLIVLLLICLSIIGFIALADEVLEGETQNFDEWAVRSLRNPADLSDPIGPRWMEEMGRDFTALGGFGITLSVTLAVCGFLIVERKFHAFWLVFGATLGAVLLTVLLKTYFARERPQLVPHLSIVHSFSFPSGHSMMASAVYLTLGTLLARWVPRRSLQIYIICVSLLLSVLVGLSRIYMGVHYPTDVLGGWAVGLAWALVCWTIARRIEHSGKSLD